jgi:hypothetical protein
MARRVQHYGVAFDYRTLGAAPTLADADGDGGASASDGGGAADMPRLPAIDGSILLVARRIASLPWRRRPCVDAAGASLPCVLPPRHTGSGDDAEGTVPMPDQVTVNEYLPGG